MANTHPAITSRPEPPTLLAPYLANEETRLRYPESLTLVDVTGVVGEKHYSLSVAIGRKPRARKDSFCIHWAVKVGAQSGWRTWISWTKDRASAEAFAATKLATLRKWSVAQ